MARFIEGEDRRQEALLPECLDGHVGEGSSGRVIDAQSVWAASRRVRRSGREIRRGEG